jgi:hypothetical protein
MKRTAIGFLAALAAFACTPPNNNNNNQNTEPDVVSVQDEIVTDTTWTADHVYQLKTHIYVKDGATLTIAAGARVQGESGSSLVITKTGKLDAAGTAAKPIVFTSSRPEGTRLAGDWGGLVMLGAAPINVSGGATAIEGFASTTDARTQYGGTDAAHNCGTLKYARIEFAGFVLLNNNELNGLTLGGCGSATTVDFVQVHRGADDGVEVFGGAVDLKHVLITQPEDDGLDWDFGWAGRVQFMVIQQGTETGNNGIEADNNKNNKEALPRSSPEIWNLTMVGAGRSAGGATKSIGMTLREGTAGKLRSVIVYGFADNAVDVDGASSAAQATAGALTLEGSIFFGNKGTTNALPVESTDNDLGFDEVAALTAPSAQNRLVDPLLADPRNLDAPSFKPLQDSPALLNALPPPSGFFSAANFVGAIGADDWTAGWSAFPQN